MERYDTVIVGAGILGLAHAEQFARRGQRVLVLERHERAEGASVRNFGMLWPIGQPAGPSLRLAERSLELWLDVLRQSGIWHERTGSLHLAYAEDEAQVLDEFAGAPANHSRGISLFDRAKVLAHSPWVRPDGLRRALWSWREVCVDPRLVVAELPDWLHRTYGVQFAFGRPALGFQPGEVATSAGPVRTRRLLVCAGAEFRVLFPEIFAASGQILCKLQMLRTAAYPPSLRLGPMLAAGLTLCHYKAFADCPTLPSLNARFQRTHPDHLRYGIHVMAAQNGLGELVLGDSHEYGSAILPFDKSAIDDLVLAYLRSFLAAPDLRVATRWHGIYAKHPTAIRLVLRPSPDATIVTGVGGAGMTLSFGLAEEVAKLLLEEEGHAP